MKNDYLSIGFKNARLSSVFAFLIYLSFMTYHTIVDVYAQEEEQKTFAQESFDDVSLIAAAGLGGGIIGLSTLSFEKYPRQHLRHVLVGGSIGIIVGVAIVAWMKATKSNLYDDDHRVFLKPSSVDQYISMRYGATKELFFELDHQRPELTSVSFSSKKTSVSHLTPLAFYWSKKF
jgi:hypothetical protein